MSGRGLRLFGAKLRKRPGAAVAGLLADYATYAGMVVFWFFLAASARPLAWLERRARRPIRARIIAWVARRARG
jgi:hypothetical protein